MSIHEIALQKLKANINHLISVVQDKTNKINKDYVWVPIIGMTGAGKTTMLHALAGRSLISAEDETGAVYLGAKELWKDGEQAFEIGLTIESQTFIPNIWVDDKNGVVFFDCPGFLDTADERRLSNAFCIDQILEKARNVKILLVITQGDLEDKAINARKCLHMLSKMIPVEEELNSAVGVVVTKLQSRRNPIGLLERIENETDECRNVISNIVHGPEKRVFVFPEPTEIGKEYHLFEDKEALQAFVKSKPVVNPHYKIVIDAGTQIMLAKLIRMFNDDLLGNVSSLAGDFRRATSTLDNESSIEQWINKLDQLDDAASKKGWNGFCECCNNVCSDKEELKLSAQKIKKLLPWIKFLESVSNASEETKKMMITNHISPDYSLKIGLHDFHSLSENLKAKVESIKKAKIEADLQMKKKNARPPPPQYHHVYDDDDDICCIQ